MVYVAHAMIDNYHGGLTPPADPYYPGGKMQQVAHKSRQKGA